MQKSRIIIVEGPQGTGKTTLTNFLRENIPASSLFRLSGQKDKSREGKLQTIKMYHNLMNYIESMQDIPMDLIFDRTFFTEEIYASLGYKDYTFHEEYQKLLQRLLSTSYDVYYFTLYLNQTDIYEERLKREHHMYQSFSVQNSIEQQNAYLSLSQSLKEYPLHVHNICMDEYDNSYEEICKILKIERNKL